MLHMIDYLFKSLFASGDRRQSRLTQVPARRKLRPSPSGTPACRGFALATVVAEPRRRHHLSPRSRWSWIQLESPKGICLQMSSSYFSWRSSCISAVQIFLERVCSEMPRAQPVGVNCARRILASHFFNKSGRLIGKEWKECTLSLTSTPGLPLLWLHPNAAHCTMFCAWKRDRRNERKQCYDCSALEESRLMQRHFPFTA